LSTALHVLQRHRDYAGLLWGIVRLLTCWERGWRSSGVAGVGGLAPEQPVHDAVAPSPGTAVELPEDSFAPEANLLEGLLFGEVVDLGSSLEAVRGRRRER
jgi:hypothetical protein